MISDQMKQVYFLTTCLQVFSSNFDSFLDLIVLLITLGINRSHWLYIESILNLFNSYIIVLTNFSHFLNFAFNIEFKKVIILVLLVFMLVFCCSATLSLQ